MKASKQAVAGASCAGVLAAAFLHQLLSRPDEVTDVCEHGAFYKDNGPSFVIGTEEKIQQFIDSCRTVFPTLGPEVRERLLRVAREGDLRRLMGSENMRYYEAISPQKCGGSARKMSKEELQRILPENAAEYLKGRLTPLMPRSIHWREVPDSFRQGEVATFDARPMLPARMFNITLEDLRRMQGTAAQTTNLYRGKGYARWTQCYEWMVWLTEKAAQWGPRDPRLLITRRFILPRIIRKHCLKPAPSLSEVADWAKDFPSDHTPWETVQDTLPDTMMIMEKRVARNKTLCSGNMNLRRLPSFKEGQLDIATKLGLASKVVHSWNFLWLGESPGIWHVDHPDNINIQLTGESHFMVFPPNCSSLVYHLQDLKYGTKRAHRTSRGAPFYHVIMRPGDGLVVPSHAMHKVVTRSPHRIAYNAFFEPKFKQMNWPSAPSNAYVREDPDSWAMRVLWLRGVKHLWDTKKVHLAMHTERLEDL